MYHWSGKYNRLLFFQQDIDYMLPTSNYIFQRTDTTLHQMTYCLSNSCLRPKNKGTKRISNWSTLFQF